MISVDDLVGMSILTSESDTIYTDVFFTYPTPNNCHQNTVPFTASETRSLFCDEPLLAKSIVLFKNLPYESHFHVCEVEVYNQRDQTDIPEASWESEWVTLELPLENDLPVTWEHGLSTMPIYGRVLVQALSGSGEGFVYPDVPQNSGYYGLTLKYNDLEAKVTFDDEAAFYCPVNDVWTAALSPCIQSGMCTRCAPKHGVLCVCLFCSLCPLVVLMTVYISYLFSIYNELR